MERRYHSDKSITFLLGKNCVNAGRNGLKPGQVYESELTNEESKFVDRVLSESKHSIGEKVHETILKNGLDYLADCAQKGEDVEEKITICMGRSYDKRFVWHTDYQFKLMDAMKEGGIF